MVHADLSASVATGIVAVKTGILVLGGLITYFSLKAYRSTGARALRSLAIGFGIITLGSLLGGTFDFILGVDITTGILIDAALTFVGFAVITYSLYAE
ncbi:DUF7521 family protein [Halobellus clavatus]|jgi:hypothetical protein|uniref:YapH protein n=1 Tax=Halobellus clavatus TaxID=660517 RepID=A0A1H3IP29_9EURY|nr:hypothetical protein [Halobellus clavatus]SDY29460.1 hypothetical protein SAMN04487946_110109 [Halobellus clavatus]